MKNLKKVVALSLAAVMMFGMMVVGAGAASYADAEDISYSTAVEVMTAIGAINGNNGEFNPKGNLCRADGATIVSRVALTRANADNLTNVGTAFGDVASTHYASGAIAWANSEGIIAGSNGKFDPNGDLQGYAFAKMLLVVLGYDPEVEGYVNNADWAVNINVDAARAGLLAGLENVSLANTLTREQACQMAFNALTATMVDYTGGLKVETTDGTIVSVNSEIYNVAQTAGHWYADAAANDATILTQQLCEELYPELTAKDGYDDFDRPGLEWHYKSAAEAVAIDVDAPVAEFNTWLNDNAQKGDKVVAKALKGYDLSNGANLTIDGQADTAINADAYDEIADLTGNGTLVQVFADEDKEITDVVVINTYLADVTKVTEATETTDRYITLLSRDGGKYTFETEGYEKDDTVLFYVDKDGGAGMTPVVVAVETAAYVQEKLTINKTFQDTDGRNVGFYLNGEKLVVAERIVNDAAFFAKLDTYVASKINVWFDSYGNVLDITLPEAAKIAPKYAIVEKFAVDAHTYNDTDVATLLCADGTRLTDVTVQDVNPGAPVGVYTPGIKAGIIVSYSQNMKGEYVLTPVANFFANAKDAKIEVLTGVDTIKTTPADAANVGVITGETAFLLGTYNKDTKAYDYEVCFGFAQIPNIELAKAAAGDVKYIYDDNNNIVFAYIDVTNNVYGYEPVLTDWVYILSKPTKVVEEQGNKVVTYYNYDALVGGEEKVISVATNTYNAGEFYPVVMEDRGFLTLLTADEKNIITGHSGTGVEAVVNSVIGVDNKYYGISDDAVAVYVDEDGEATVMDINKIKTDSTDTVEYALNYNEKTKVWTLTHVIVEQVNGTTTAIDSYKTLIGGKDNNLTEVAPGSEITISIKTTNMGTVESVDTIKVAADAVDGAASATVNYTLVAEDGETEVKGTLTINYTIKTPTPPAP